MTATLFLALDEAKQAYSERLRVASATNDSGIIGNRFPWQTRLALETLIRKATLDKVPVRAFCGGFPLKFYEDGLLALVKQYLSLGYPMQVAVWHDDLSVIATSILELPRQFKNFEIRYSKTREMANKLPHFFLVGDSAYRQEVPHEDFKDEVFSEVSPEIPAAICFNDPEGAKPLLAFFERIWGICKPVGA